MKPYYEDEAVTLWHQPTDGFSVLASLPDASVDAVVTDPPYGLEFMGKEWDGADGFRRSLNPADVERDSPFGRTSRTSPEYRAGQTFGLWCLAWSEECLRVLKPGGHLLAFGGTRTSHRLACAVEDAGFEIRDSIAWMYGSGFPKSLDVSKAIDKAAGAERATTSARIVAADRWTAEGRAALGRGESSYALADTAPATPDAERWQGWGTALKPAHEPIVVARKPLAGTVAANVLAHGTGALNIDGCRICGENQAGWHRDARDDHAAAHGTRDGEASAERRYTERGGTNFAPLPGVRGGDPSGRWPANVVLDESQAAALDEQSGILTSGIFTGKRNTPKFGDTYQPYEGARDEGSQTYGDSGGASRFFYVAKASAHERVRVNGTAHPTVKPIALMRWLVRLVTPPGGTVLEPFAGSGTTVEACIREGLHCVAIEREADYLPLIEARIERATTPLQYAVKHTPPPPGQVAFDFGGEAS